MAHPWAGHHESFEIIASGKMLATNSMSHYLFKVGLCAGLCTMVEFELITTSYSPQGNSGNNPITRES